MIYADADEELDAVEFVSFDRRLHPGLSAVYVNDLLAYLERSR
jgi:hypothetical protein